MKLAHVAGNTQKKSNRDRKAMNSSILTSTPKISELKEKPKKREENKETTPKKTILTLLARTLLFLPMIMTV